MQTFVSKIRSTAFLFLSLFCLIGNALFAQAEAQEETARIQSTSIIEQISKGESVDLNGVTIEGNLDFSTVTKRMKGGSYGIRGNKKVQEYIALVDVPLSFSNCTFEGEIITFSEEWKGRTLQEYFTRFRNEVKFSNCIFKSEATFEKLGFEKPITVRQCVFQEDLFIKGVHFFQTPDFSQNSYKGRFVKKDTNFDADSTSASSENKKKVEEAVTISLTNPSDKSVNIVFGKNNWNLSPRGTSGLTTQVGEKIYLVKNGKKERVLLEITMDMDGKTYNVTAL